MTTTDFNANGEHFDFSDKCSALSRDNYYTKCISTAPFTLSVYARNYVLSIEACAADEKEGFIVEKHQKKYASIFEPLREFLVPFEMAYPEYKCSKCQNELKYVNGIKQYLDYGAHFFNVNGWIETKNQYYCEQCKAAAVGMKFV